MMVQLDTANYFHFYQLNCASNFSYPNFFGCIFETSYNSSPLSSSHLIYYYRPFGYNEFDGAGSGYAIKFASLSNIDENVVVGSTPATG